MSDYYPTGETALVIVPPADICAYADHYRELYMPEEVERIEPHITVTVPFVPAPLLGDSEPRLRAVLARCPAVRLSLRGFETFPETGVLYLSIAHPERVQSIYRAVLAEFPDYPIYGGQHGDDFLPHMTVGVFSDRAELERVHEELAEQRLFIGWDVEQVVVKYKMSDGIWDTWAALPLQTEGV
ncbi:MAG: 2'-5' RNA ligase family protein [Chloroflexota bacterium]